MKKLLVVLCSLLGAGTLFANTLSNLSNEVYAEMATDQGYARVHALGQARAATLTEWSDETNWDDTNTWATITVQGDSLDDVMGKIFAHELGFVVRNWSTVVHGSLWVYDEGYYPLFYAGIDYINASSWTKGKPTYTLWPQYIPMFSGVQSAEVLAFTSPGQFGRSYPLAVTADGRALVPFSAIGTTNTLMSLQIKDKGQVEYHMSHHSFEPGKPFQRNTVKYRVGNHTQIVSTNGEAIVVNVPDYTAQSVELKLDKRARVTFMAPGLMWDDAGLSAEMPFVVILTNEHGKEKQIVVRRDNRLPSDMLPAGTYKVYFQFDRFGLSGLWPYH